MRVWSEWVRVSGLHTGFGAVRGGETELPKILGGQRDTGVYSCTETGGV